MRWGRAPWVAPVGKVAEMLDVYAVTLLDIDTRMQAEPKADDSNRLPFFISRRAGTLA